MELVQGLKKNKQLKAEKTTKTINSAASATPMKKVMSVEPFIFMAVFLIFFGWMGSKMGVINMMNTLMNTAFDLLLNTCFYIMSIAVLAGAIAALLTEFGIVAVMNKIISPLMRPLYGLPGASIIGVFATYLPYYLRRL